MEMGEEPKDTVGLGGSNLGVASGRRGGEVNLEAIRGPAESDGEEDDENKWSHRLQVNNKLMLFWELLLLLISLAAGQEFSLAITPSNSVVQTANVSYQFQIFRFSSTPVPAGTTIKATFPTAFSSTFPVVSCIWQDGASTPCTYSNRILTIQNKFPTASTANSFGFTMTGITNPVPAISYDIIGQLFNGTTLFEKGTASVTMGMADASCSISLKDCLVYEQCWVMISYSSTIIQAVNSFELSVIMAESYPSDPTGADISASMNRTVTQLSNYWFEFTFANSFWINMLMPPSTEGELNFIYIKSFVTLSKGNIDQCYLSISELSPNRFTNLAFSALVVQDFSNLTVSFQVNTPILDTDSIVLDFSGSDFDLSQVSSTATFTQGAIGQKPLTKTATTISISDLTSSANPILKQVKFIVKNIGAPLTNKLQSVQLTTKTNSSYIRDQSSLSYQATIGTLSGLSFVCSDTQIGKTTSCVISLSLGHSLPSTGIVRIAFPTGFSLSDKSCSTNGGSLNLSPICTVNATANSIVVSNISSSSLPAGSQIKITRQFVLPTMPGTFSITFTTQSADLYTIDQATTTMTTITRKLINQQDITITPGTNLTNTLTTFTVVLAIPISAPSLNFTINLGLNSNGPTVNQGAINSVYNYPTLTMYGVGSGTFVIDRLITRQSTQPLNVSGSLTYNSVEYFVFTSYLITMTTPSTFARFDFMQSSQVVGESSVAHMNISGLSVGDILVFPLQYYASTQTGCSSNSNCAFDGQVTILQVGTEFTTISVNMQNPGYYASIPFTVDSYESTKRYKKQTKTLTISSIYLNQITTAITQNKPYYLQNSVYQVNATLSTPFPQASTVNSLKISIPTDFKFIALTCTIGCTASQQLIDGTLTLPITSTFIRFAITLTNPHPDNTSLQITLFSESSLGLMDEGAFSFVHPCTLPCRSCAVSSPATCSSCYTWEPENKLRNGTCVTACSSNQFYDNVSSLPTNMCQPCSSSCSACQFNSTYCQSCSSGFYLFGSSCLDICPEAHYSDSVSATCEMCSTNCITCSGADSCSKCNNSTLLYQASCWSTCPSGSYNSSTQACIACNQTCLTCISASFCTACKNTYYLYQGVCLSSCPNSTFAEDYTSGGLTLHRCASCPTICTSCSSSTTCHSCAQGYKLYNFNCQKDCPATYFNDNSKCEPCVSPCENCSSLSVCLSCADSSLYLQSGKCVENCSVSHPNNQTMVCEGCRSPCSACTWSDTCTSCVDSFLLFGSTCVKKCSTGWYATNGICTACPANCSACVLQGNTVLCTSCLDSYAIYDIGCILPENCPPDTTKEGSYCISPTCDSLSNCLTCSGLRCVECDSSFSLSSTTGKCTAVAEDSKSIAAVSELPVPFPFVIATIIIIILAFLIRMQFPKMFAPLFIYSFMGIAEVGLLALWIALIYTRGISETKLGTYLKLAATALCIIYLGMNLLGFFLYLKIIRSDNKFRVWEMQDNRCASITVTILALLFSFRFSLLKYSKLGHLQKFSATLASDSRLSHENLMAYLSIPMISVPAIVISGWISYVQVSMNYLFFTSMEVTIFQIAMTVVSILQSLTPKGYVMEHKDEYRQGHDSQNLEGESLEQVILGMGVVEEEYHEGKQINSQDDGDRVGRRNHPSDDDSDEDGDRDEHGGNGTSTFIRSKARDEKLSFDDIRVPNQRLTPIDQRQELEQILFEAEKLAETLDRPSRPFGFIKKQNLRDLSSSSSSEGVESEMSDDEPYPIDFPAKSGGRRWSKPISSERALPTTGINEMLDQLEMGERRLGMKKLKHLMDRLALQEQEERDLRSRLERVTEEERKLKQKQFEKARQMVERNQMSLQENMTRVQNLFEARAERQKARKEKIKNMEMERKKDREDRKKKSTFSGAENFIAPQVEEADPRLIHVQERQNRLKMDEEQWPEPQEPVDFLPTNQWRITEQQHEQTNLTTETPMKFEVQAPGEQKWSMEEQDHWPIDIQLEQRINQVEERANGYLRERRKKDLYEEYDLSIESELGTAGEELYYEEEEEDLGKQSEGRLEVEEGIKIPKKRVNRNVIDLSPGS